MAVSKVKKLELIAHAQCREEILKALRELGSVHISDIRELLPDSEPKPPDFLKTSLSRVQSKLDQVVRCSRFLDRFIPKPSLVESLLTGKLVFTERELENCLVTFDLEGLDEECTSIENELAANESRIEKNESLIADVSLWLALDYPLESIRDTNTTRITLGICETRAFNSMTDELSTVSSQYHIEIVERSRTSVSMVTMYPQSLEDSIGPVLRKHGWRAVEFRGLTGRPTDIVARLREEIGELQERNRHLKGHVKDELVRARKHLLLLHDHYTQELKTLEVQQILLFTSHTFFISGWVVERRAEALRKRLGEITMGLDMKLSDPSPDDRVPILLENNAASKPFSLITELYGRPQYAEFDPTPLFAPFFVLFFGVCLGEAGYGFVLALGSYIALKKFKIHEGARKLLQILLWGGLSSMVVGLLTGGVFGIELTKLPPIFRKILLFNPTEQVVLFLYIAFLLGLIQVLFGLGVKMARDLRDRDFAAAVIDQGLWMLLLVFVAPLLFKYLFGGKVSDSIASFAGKASLVVAIPLVLGKGRHARKLLLQPLLGLLLCLRDALGFFGDVLSYARLMALGLATSFLAMTINILAGLVLGIPYGIGYVFAVLVLIGGHSFNIAINSLGAFVHTLRLQYLEFFSKFFIGGGEPFVPFAETRAYTVVQSGLREEQ